jgi:hypothetical protein
MSAEIVPISEIKKRKSASDAYRGAYETPNPHENTGFSRRSRKIQIQKTSKLAKSEVTPEFAVIDFRDEQPTTTALATIPSQKMSTVSQKLPSQQKHGSVSRVPPREISVSKTRSEKSRKNYKKLFNDIENIQDATFTEEFGEEEKPAVAAISASKVKSLAVGKKQEPESMKAISAQKRNIKSKLVKVESVEKSPSFVSDGFRVESSSTVKSANKTKTINDRWLIDAAADELYHTVRVAGKVGKKALKEGFKGAKTGIKAINELSELAVQNPVLIQIGKVHTEDMKGMAVGARRARGSIIATGNNANKRYMSAGSLVTQRGFVNRTNTTTTGATQRVFPKIVHRKGGDIVKYFSAAGIEISAAQARRILNGAPLPTVNNQAVATYQTDTDIRGVVNPVVPNPLGTQRRQGNPIGEITRATHASGLVRRAKTTVGVVQSAVQNSYTPTGAINTTTTATQVVKNPTGFVQQNHSPVVDISRIVTPSRLFYRHMEA